MTGDQRHLEKLLSRITLNPDISHGQPSIRNTRYKVAAILEYLAGDSIDVVLAEFPDIEETIFSLTLPMTPIVRHEPLGGFSAI